MLINTIHLIRRHFNMLERLGLVQHEWPPDQVLPTPTNSKWRWLCYQANFTIQNAYSIFMPIHYFLSMEGMDVYECAIGALFSAHLIWAGLMRLSLSLDNGAGQFRPLDACLTFERKQGMKAAEGRSDELLGKLSIMMGYMTPIVGTSIIGAIISVSPCVPSTIGFIIYHWGGHCHVYNSGWMWIASKLTLMVDLYIWFGVASVASFQIFEEALVYIGCLEQYLRHTAKLLGGKVSKEGRGLRNYKQVQILGDINNETFQMVVIPSIMLISWNAFVVSIYTSVKLHSVIDMPGFAVFPFTLLLASFEVFTFQIGSKVWAQSEKCVSVAKNSSRRRSAHHKRMVNAMGKVKIKFGSDNFMDMQTPFNLINHALGNCVDLMLLLT